MITPFRRTALASAVLPLGVALALFFLHRFQLINFHELDAVDLRLKLRGSVQPHDSIVLVEIDDRSLEELGPRPWPRSLHTTLLKVLDKYEPRYILYHAPFTEPGSLPQEDQDRALAMERSANVILPFHYYSERPLKAFYPMKLLRESARAVGFERAQQYLGVRV
jgi:CHASE2 domain-containing sensor protein